jgi:hypothetical protein
MYKIMKSKKPTSTTRREGAGSLFVARSLASARDPIAYAAALQILG